MYNNVTSQADICCSVWGQYRAINLFHPCWIARCKRMVLDLEHRSRLDAIVGSFLQYYLLDRPSVSGREILRDVNSIRNQLFCSLRRTGYIGKNIPLMKAHIGMSWCSKITRWTMVHRTTI
jgi:hypothetical protein